MKRRLLLSHDHLGVHRFSKKERERIKKLGSPSTAWRIREYSNEAKPE